MAWEWSHTDEALNQVQENLSTMPRQGLVCIAAEWDSWDGDTATPNMDLKKCERALLDRFSDDRDTLEAYVWEKMSAHDTGRICDNGGHLAWTCPFGCEIHKLPFSHPHDAEG